MVCGATRGDGASQAIICCCDLPYLDDERTALPLIHLQLPPTRPTKPAFVLAGESTTSQSPICEGYMLPFDELFGGAISSIERPSVTSITETMLPELTVNLYLSDGSCLVEACEGCSHVGKGSKAQS